MPGSCDSEQSSSPSLISSLRRFRFQNKSKQPQTPDTSAQCSSSSSSSTSGQPTNSSKGASSSQKASSTAYNPLSYRKYENPNDSVVLLQSIHSKIQVSFKNNTTNSVLDLVLTTEETKKLKDTVLEQPSVSVKWATNITEYDSKDSGGKLLKIKRLFMCELSKLVSSVLNNKSAKSTGNSKPGNPPIKTYSKVQRSESTISQSTVNNSLASEDHTQVAMDDYEEFCEKEQCLRKLLDAFPGSDIMEAQDILVKCQWDLNKAMIEAQNQPLKTTRKRGFPGTFQQPQVAGNMGNQRPVINAQQNPNAQKNIPEEIVLDSSDEEEMNGSSSQQSNSSGLVNDISNQNLHPAKRARRLISTDSEDEVATPAAKSPLNSSYQKSQLTVSQKPNTSVQLPLSQKSAFSVQSSASQKSTSSMQLPPPQKPISSGQPPAPQKSASSGQSLVSQKSNSSLQSTPVRTSSNQSNASEKTINVPQSLSIKPVSSSANNEKTPSSMTSLPKGLVATPVNSDKTPSSMPNLPKGLVSTPVGSEKAPSSLPNLPKGLVSTPVNNEKAPSSSPMPNLPKGLVSTPVNNEKAPSIPNLPKGLVSTPVNSEKAPSIPNLPKGLVSTPVNNEKVASSSMPNLPKGLVSTPVNNEKASSSVPNLPKGLVITQVGGADNLPKKSENEGASANGSNSNIPPNSSKNAYLVRIKPSTGVSVSPSTSTSSSVTSSNATLDTSTANKAATKGKKANATPKTTPKALSITPVSSIKEPAVKDKSPISSTEDESNTDIKSGPNNQTVKKVGAKKVKASKILENSNNIEQPVVRREKGKKRNKLMSGKRKKISSDEDDEEEYGNADIYDSEDSDCEENLTSAHSAVLKFFQESSAEELGSIPGCSKKKIEAILNYRPFAKWLDLVEKLRNDKSLSTDLLNGAKKVLDMRNAVTKLMTKCQRISLDMEDLVENLKENKETCSGYVGKQPDLLNERMHLTAYQMLGLNWLLLMHNQQVNAILADEMGLGKTVQAISFLAYLKQIEEEGPHLIVVPSSTLDNWRKELETWWPTVSVICYHGQQESRRELRMQILNDEVEEFDIMITTYNMVTSSAEDRNFFKRLEFNYVVFDEAHMLKNMASQRYTNLMRIKAPRRLLLTGTPLQNNLVELMSLLIFAMPHMFSGKIEQIKQMFSCVSKASGNKNTYEKDRIEHAKRIMKPFVLRRLKRDVLKELPNKHDETRYCSMVEDQNEKYAALIQKFSAEVESSAEKDPASSGAGMMMQLRRAANHPLLLRRFFDDDKLLEMSKLMLKEPTHNQSDPNIIFEDMSVMSDFELHKLCLQYKSLKAYVLPDDVILNSGKFKILDELLPDLIKEDHRILLFSQFTMVLDIIQEYMNIKKYKYLRLDGQVPVSERQQLIDDFNNDPEILVFLLSTKAGGLGINLTAADTVILHDIDFNPYNDKQAEDRCHRVGQVRDVRVIRLISEKTIEEGILQRAKEKLKLEKDIHDEGDNEENDTASVAMLLRDALGLKSSKS